MPRPALPHGYHTLIPYLFVEGAAAAIDFYCQAFGAVETMRMPWGEGRIGHAELKIGDSPLMLADANPAGGIRDPRALGGSAMSILLYVDDVDRVFARALALGAKEIRPVKDQFYGDRSGALEDPFGHLWNIATHVEDVTPEEMNARAAKLMGGPG